MKFIVYVNRSPVGEPIEAPTSCVALDEALQRHPAAERVEVRRAPAEVVQLKPWQQEMLQAAKAYEWAQKEEARLRAAGFVQMPGSEEWVHRGSMDLIASYRVRHPEIIAAWAENMPKERPAPTPRPDRFSIYRKE